MRSCVKKLPLHTTALLVVFAMAVVSAAWPVTTVRADTRDEEIVASVTKEVDGLRSFVDQSSEISNEEFFLVLFQG
jgi:hypothetical protein